MIAIRTPSNLIDLLLPTLFEIERRGSTAVITWVGDSQGLSDEDFSTEVDNLRESIGPEVTAIVVDLSQSNIHTSDRLVGPLIVLWNWLRARNGSMALCGVSEYAREVLKRTRLESLWPICHSRESAMRAINCA